MAGSFRSAQGERTLSALREFFAASPASRARPEAAEAKLLELFQRAARDVPAYRRFLAASAVEPERITSLAAFRELPITTKDNYHRQHPLADLCWQGALDACDIVALSSGSTGEPAVWPRFVTDELATAARFEQVLAGAFDAGQRRTLAVICFALGNWVGGLFTLACCRLLAAKGYPLTVIAPGNNPGEILRALRAMSASYDQRVLFGYPPFIKDVVDMALAEGLDLSRPRTRLVFAGEVFSESFRDWVSRGIGADAVEHGSASLYGTADGGVLANETPLSIRIRRALAEQPAAARELFGEARLPTLCQYDPEHRFFEVEGGSLLFSGDSGAPLLRYKILDRGGLISHADMFRRLAELGVHVEGASSAAALPELPFVYVFGRSHFAISFYGANVYPENVTPALEQPAIAPLVTGKFVIEPRTNAEQQSELVLTVELARAALPSDSLARAVAREARLALERLNSEFASYVPADRRSPSVELRSFEDAEYFPRGVKHRYTRA